MVDSALVTGNLVESTAVEKSIAKVHRSFDIITITFLCKRKRFLGIDITNLITKVSLSLSKLTVSLPKSRLTVNHHTQNLPKIITKSA